MKSLIPAFGPDYSDNQSPSETPDFLVVHRPLRGGQMRSATIRIAVVSPSRAAFMINRNKVAASFSASEFQQARDTLPGAPMERL